MTINRVLAGIYCLVLVIVCGVGVYADTPVYGVSSGDVSSTRAINTTSPLSGGGDLSADRTLSIQVATGAQNGYLSSTDWTTFNNKQAALGFTAENSANKAAANGYASLNASSKVVQDPANATTTPGAGKIPIADGSGLLDAWVTPGGGISNITSIPNRSHTDMQDIGSNNHIQIDSFISSKASASGLASLDSNSRVVQDPASVKGGSIQRIAYKWTVGAGHTGNTSETSVHSWAMPGSTVVAGDIVRITSYVSFTNNTNSKNYRVKFGGTTYTNIGYSSVGAAKYQTDIIVRDTTSQLTCQSTGNSNGGWSTSSNGNSSTENTAGSITIDFTWQLANGSDTATLEAVTIEVL